MNLNSVLGSENEELMHRASWYTCGAVEMDSRCRDAARRAGQARSLAAPGGAGLPQAGVGLPSLFTGTHAALQPRGRATSVIYLCKSLRALSAMTAEWRHHQTEVKRVFRAGHIDSDSTNSHEQMLWKVLTQLFSVSGL